MAETAPIGHNNPPQTIFEQHQAEINDLYDEAKLWLDGEPVETAGLAEGLSTLMQTIRKAGADADRERAAEKAPHLEAGREIDARWKTLTKLTNLATAACKEALKPWLIKIEAEKKEADRIAQEDADAKLAEARKAMQASSVDNLIEREEAEEKLKAAEISKAVANKKQRETAGVKNKGGRAVSLRTVYVTELIDANEALEHFWPSMEIEELLLTMAKRQVANGKRALPGFKITEEKVTV